MMRKLCIGVILYMVLASWIGLWGDIPSCGGNVCSKATGYWNNVDIWDIGCDGNTGNDDRIPTSTDNVCISAGHTVTLDISGEVTDLLVEGTLDLGNATNVLTVNGNITISLGGILNGGFGAVLEFKGSNPWTINGAWNPQEGKVRWVTDTVNIQDFIPDPTSNDYYDLEIASSSGGLYTIPSSSTIKVGNMLRLAGATATFLTVSNGGVLVVGNNGNGGIDIWTGNVLECSTTTPQPVIEFSGSSWTNPPTGGWNPDGCRVKWMTSIPVIDIPNTANDYYDLEIGDGVNAISTSISGVVMVLNELRIRANATLNGGNSIDALELQGVGLRIEEGGLWNPGNGKVVWNPVFTPQLITNPPQFDEEFPSFSQAVGKIIFRRFISNNIYSVNIDGSNETLLDSSFSRLPLLSPDGTKILLRSIDGNIKIINLVGTPQSTSINVSGLVHTGGSGSSSPKQIYSWAPDGSKIAFIGTNGSVYDIYIVNIDGTGLTQLTNDGINKLSPVWSPDGNKIAFIKDSGNGFRLFVMDNNGGNVRELVSQIAVRAEYPVVWTPDSKKIIFVAEIATGHPEVFVIDDIDNPQPRQLTSSVGSGHSPVLSSDGRTIAFISDGQLALIDIDGSNFVKLTNPEFGDCRQPQWLPDGSGITFIATNGSRVAVINTPVVTKTNYYNLEIASSLPVSFTTGPAVVTVTNNFILNGIAGTRFIVAEGGKLVVGNNGLGSININANNRLDGGSGVIQPVIEFFGSSWTNPPENGWFPNKGRVRWLTGNPVIDIPNTASDYYDLEIGDGVNAISTSISGVVRVLNELRIRANATLNGGGINDVLEFAGNAFIIETSPYSGRWVPGGGRVRWMSNTPIPDLVTSCDTVEQIQICSTTGLCPDFYDLEIVGTPNNNVVNIANGATIITIANTLMLDSGVTLNIGQQNSSITLYINKIDLGDAHLRLSDNSALKTWILEKNIAGNASIESQNDTDFYSLSVCSELNINSGETLIKNTDSQGLNVTGNISNLYNVHFERTQPPETESCHLNFTGSFLYVKGIGVTFDKNSSFLVCATDTDPNDGYDVILQFDIEGCPQAQWANCITNVSSGAQVQFIDGLSSMVVLTRDETGGLIRDSIVKIYKGVAGQPVSCSDIQNLQPAIIAKDGNSATDIDGQVNGRVHIKLFPVDFGVPVTIVVENPQYLPFCDDNDGSGYYLNSMAEPGMQCWSKGDENPYNNCFVSKNKFPLKVDMIKRTDNNFVGISSPDFQTKAVAFDGNTRILVPQTLLTGSATIDFGADEKVNSADTIDDKIVIVGATNRADGFGGDDFLIVKLDRYANIEWNRIVGGDGDDEAIAVLPTDNGEVIVAGNTKSNFGQSWYNSSTNDILIVKLDRMGKVVWMRVYGTDADDTAVNIVHSGDSGILTIFGNTNTSGNYDIVVLKINEQDGTILEQTIHGTNDNDKLRGVSELRDGGILAVIETNNGSNIDTIAVKVDSNGNIVWTKKIGGDGNDIGVVINEVEGGTYIMAGYTNSFGAGGYDFWVVKLNNDDSLTNNDDSDDIIWQKTYGGSGDEILTTAGIDVIHNIIGIGGTTTSFGAQGLDSILMVLDPRGEVLAEKIYGGSGDDIIVSGTSGEGEELGLVGITNTFGNNNDIWLLKVDIKNISIHASGCPSDLIRDVQNLSVNTASAVSSSITLTSGSVSMNMVEPPLISGYEVANISPTLQCGAEEWLLKEELIQGFGNEGDEGARFCGDNDSYPPGEIDCSSTYPNVLLIPYNQDSQLPKVNIFIAGYLPKDINLTGVEFNSQKTLRIAPQNECSSPQEICTDSYLEFGMVISEIRDEFGYRIGIGNGGQTDKGSRSLADSQYSLGMFVDEPDNFDITAFAGVNGRPFLSESEGKWYVPYSGNFLPDTLFQMRIPGFVQHSVFIPQDFFTEGPGNEQIVQRDLAFLNINENVPVNGCSGKPQSICVSPFLYAIKLTLKVKPGVSPAIPFNELGIELNNSATGNTWLKYSARIGGNWQDASGSDFNSSTPGVLNPNNTSILGAPIKGFLGSCDITQVKLEYVVDGFTKGIYTGNGPECNNFEIQWDDSMISTPTYSSFVVFIRNVKDELGNNFKIGGICPDGFVCGDSDINLNTFDVMGNGSGPYSVVLVKIFNDQPYVYIALSGTKALAEGVSLSGNFGLKIKGFGDVNSDILTTPSFALNLDTSVEVVFGDSNCSSPAVCASPLRYKLVFDKLIVQDSPTTTADVSSQLPTLVSNNRIGIVHGDPLGFNGSIKISTDNKLYIPVFAQSGSSGPYRLAIGSGAGFTGSIPFTVGSNTLFFSATTVNISSIFSTGGGKLLQYAPSSLCGTTSSILCANSSLQLVLPVIDSFSIVSPASADIDGDGVLEYGGFGGQSFTVQFKYTDPSNLVVTGCTPKFYGNVLPLSSAISEVDPQDTTTSDGKFYRCSFAIPFAPPPQFNRDILKGNLFLSAQSSAGISTGFFDTTLPVGIKNNPPQLLSGNVSPASGNVGDSFTFSVVYKDVDNQPPAFVRLYIDLNGTGSIGNLEVFDMVKQNINDNNFSTGVVYTKTLSNLTTTSTGVVLFGFGTTDGFLTGTTNDFAVTFLPANFNQQSCVINNSFSVTIVKPSSANPPILEVAGIPGFQTTTSFGLVEPDSGSSSDLFTFMIKYTSFNNLPATYVKINLFFHSWGPRILPMNKLNSSSISSLPSTLAGLISSTLYDGDFTNGEIYFVRTKLPDKRVFIQGIEASDGIFTVGKKGDGQDIIISGVDADNDGVDDSLENPSTLNNASKIVVPTFENIPDTAQKITISVTPTSGSSGTPKFTSVVCSDLISGIEDIGPLTPPGSNMILLSPLCNIKVNTGGASSVDFTFQLPAPLPTGGKVFKLVRGKLWEDITNAGTLSTDRTTLIIPVADNSLRDFDLRAGVISDPVAVFAPTIQNDEVTVNEGSSSGNGSNQSLASGFAGGGGGCYVSPKINNSSKGSDGGLLIIIIAMCVWVLYRRRIVFS